MLKLYISFLILSSAATLCPPFVLNAPLAPVSLRPTQLIFNIFEWKQENIIDLSDTF